MLMDAATEDYKNDYLFLGHFFLRVDDNEKSNQEKLTVVMNIEEPFK